MVLYNLEEVTDDMTLGKSIFLPSGELLLAAGFRLTENYRKRLKQFGFTSVYIQIPGTEEVIPQTIISEHVQQELTISLNKNIHDLQKSFSMKQMSTASIRTMLRTNKEYLNKYLTNSGIIHAIDKLIEEILTQPSILLNLQTMQKAGDHLFNHVINVTVISCAIGKKYRYTYEEMKQLAIGAINFDLGLIALPPEIRNKTTPLSDEEHELYIQHTVYGYLMLSQNPAITPTSAVIALQHHECQDGSGFPRNLHGENLSPLKDFSRKSVIHRFAEIVAVADKYDCLIHGRYCTAQPVRKAIETLIRLAGTHLNKEIVRTLTSIIPVYPVGAKIRIADSPIRHLIGYYGVVARVNEKEIDKPEIVLFETKNRQTIKPILINLATHTGFELEAIT